jgi:hypothetical protein
LHKGYFTLALTIEKPTVSCLHAGKVIPEKIDKKKEAPYYNVVRDLRLVSTQSNAARTSVSCANNSSTGSPTRTVNIGYDL